MTPEAERLHAALEACRHAYEHLVDAAFGMPRERLLVELCAVLGVAPPPASQPPRTEEEHP